MNRVMALLARRAYKVKFYDDVNMYGCLLMSVFTSILHSYAHQSYAFACFIAISSISKTSLTLSPYVHMTSNLSRMYEAASTLVFRRYIFVCALFWVLCTINVDVCKRYRIGWLRKLLITSEQHQAQHSRSYQHNSLREGLCCHINLIKLHYAVFMCGKIVCAPFRAFEGIREHEQRSYMTAPHHCKVYNVLQRIFIFRTTSKMISQREITGAN